MRCQEVKSFWFFTWDTFAEMSTLARLGSSIYRAANVQKCSKLVVKLTRQLKECCSFQSPPFSCVFFLAFSFQFFYSTLPGLVVLSGLLEKAELENPEWQVSVLRGGKRCKTNWNLIRSGLRKRGGQKIRWDTKLGWKIRELESYMLWRLVNRWFNKFLCPGIP